LLNTLREENGLKFSEKSLLRRKPGPKADKLIFQEILVLDSVLASLPLKMTALGCSKTPGTNYPLKQLHISEEKRTSFLFV